MTYQGAIVEFQGDSVILQWGPYTQILTQDEWAALQAQNLSEKVVS